MDKNDLKKLRKEQLIDIICIIYGDIEREASKKVASSSGYCLGMETGDLIRSQHTLKLLNETINAEIKKSKQRKIENDLFREAIKRNEEYLSRPTLEEFLDRNKNCKEIRVEFKWWDYDLSDEENHNRESDEEYSIWGTYEDVLRHYTGNGNYSYLDVMDEKVIVVEESKDLCIVEVWRDEVK